MLLFKKRFLDAIRSGQKTQTIRLWPHRRMRAGQRSYIPGAGYIQVESVEKVEFEQLTDADAVPDGFPTVVELRAEIDQIYRESSCQMYETYRIRFRLLDPAEQEQARLERRSR